MSDQQATPSGTARNFQVRILRQDGPGKPSYWETFLVDYESDMNVISVLQKIAAKGENIEGKKVAPVAWDCGCLEEVCGACTMLVNGRVRQSCSALVDRLLEDRPGVIELQPMTKFPVVRDLIVDPRGCSGPCSESSVGAGGRLLPHGRRASADSRRSGSPLSAQPVHELRVLPGRLSAVHKIEIPRKPGESEEQYRNRRYEVLRHAFPGRSCDQPGRLVQLASHRRQHRRTASGRLMAPGRTAGLRQRTELRCRLSQRDPLTHVDRPCRQRATTLHAIKLIFDR
jgi:succinate dehydrogenase / fumarate reductase, iron-sulfur subunit